MASPEIIKRLEDARAGIRTVEQSQSFRNMGGMADVMISFSEARGLAIKWIDRVEPKLAVLGDSSLLPLAVFVESIGGIVDRRQLRPGETISTALRGGHLRVHAELAFVGLRALRSARDFGAFG
jgi:hypothetical protein